MSETPISRRESFGGLAGLVLAAAGCAEIHDVRLQDVNPVEEDYNSGIRHMEAGNWGMASQEFDRVIAVDNHHSAAYFHRAQSYRHRSDIRALIGDDESIAMAYRYNLNALHDLLRAVELDDSVPDYHALLGYTYARLDKGKDALKAINRAVELFDQGKKLRYAPTRYLRVDESRIRDDRKRLNELYRKDA